MKIKRSVDRIQEARLVRLGGAYRAELSAVETRDGEAVNYDVSGVGATPVASIKAAWQHAHEWLREIGAEVRTESSLIAEREEEDRIEGWTRGELDDEIMSLELRIGELRNVRRGFHRTGDRK